MTRKGARSEAVQLKHACNHCGSPASVWCKTRTGRWASRLHALRFYAAVRAGDLPIALLADGGADWGDGR